MSDWRSEAEEAFRSGNYGAARDILEAGLRSDGPEATIFYDLGLTYVELQEPSRAAKAFARAIPSIPEALASRGLAYDKMGEPELARADYFAALHHDPNDVDTLINLGTLELQVGSIESAERYLARARELDAAANWQYADVLVAQGDNKGARTALELALSIGETRALLDLALLEEAEHKFEAARLKFEQALTSGATFASREYVRFLLSLGDLETGRKVAQAAVDSGDKWSLAPLGAVHERLGQLEEAERYFRAARDHGDDDFRSELGLD